MTAIFNTLLDPNDAPLAGRQVTLQLVTAGFVDDGQSEILRTAYSTTDDTGRYEYDDVEPNATIDPTGTYYLLNETGTADATAVRWSIVVPDSGTALWVKDLLVDNPPSPAAVVAGVVELVAGAGISIDSTDPQQPIVSATGGGGGGTVLTYSLAAASSWTQVHSFTYDPAVRVIDAGGSAVDTDVSYPDATHVHLMFAVPFTGTVALS